MPDEALRRRIAALPRSDNEGAALERLIDAADRDGVRPAIDALLADREIAGFLGSALGDCPYLLDIATRDPVRVLDILSEPPEARLARISAEIAGAGWASRPEAMQSLRRAKQDVALSLGLADLARAMPLDEVTGSLTDFADSALQAALRFALAEAARQGKWVGGTETTGFFVLAMGKYGANELNYSSDIDIMAFFDPAAPGPAEGVEPTGFWVRIVRMLVTLLQERTADGYVFRTDLRLRPDPAATAVAIAAPAALNYYESMGQNWERVALIKARAAAGDIAAGEAFIGEIAPFIWRKYLDFAAIADIHSIKRQVHAHRGHASVRVLGHDIKRGRGGIREIEFFVQTQQLIAGGRDRLLRGRETRPMLAKLAARGWIDEAARKELDEAYVLLRMVEHRLQMVRDEQTHTMPQQPEELARIARLTGYSDAGAFETEMRRTMEMVARRYSELFEESADLSSDAGNLVFTGGEDDPETLEALRRLGYREPENVTSAVRAWHFGRFAAMRSTAAREALTEITPALLSAFGRAGNADAGLKAFDRLLQALPAGAQLFALLTKNRELLDLLASILAAAPGLAEVFARRPHVVDALLGPAARAEEDRSNLAEQLEASLTDALSYEDALNRARSFTAEHRFRISVGLLNGTLTPSGAGEAFSDLAGAVVAQLFQRTRREFERQHGRLAGGQTAVLAFGRLGSREMTAGSDLDLIVIYDHAPDTAASDGKRPLAPSQYHTRLTQRLVAALAAPTAEGIAYAVDLRLRPSGQWGPLATHIDAFTHYHLNEAWTWEHMSMSRGRPIAGDAELSARVNEALDGIASAPRDRTKLAKDVAAMRARIEHEKVASNVLDVKLARGGLMDCEFAAQFLVLAGLGRRSGEPTLQTLRRAVETGGVAARDGGVLVRSAILQSAILQLLRIAGETASDPGQLPEALKKLLVSGSAATLRVTGQGGDEINSFEAMTEQLGLIQIETRQALEGVLGVAVA